MAEWKKIASGVGAAALVLAGSYLGLDGGDQNSTAPENSQGSQNSESQSSTASSAKPGPNSGSNKAGAKGATCTVNTLPEEADDVIDRILTDQDHIYSQHDGKHFGNYEGRLPRQRGEYYREYTVTTPGNSSRGARRIVVGGGSENDPDVWYYTDDHYESFCEIPDAED
ncbi:MULTISPECIES: ribonuclease domain-containing protein [unclassified Corynebacterium]|uniref:ribonuclease domain-containing protein n=1 Tax=unclassified Corynebacterium TaxID=2624378 RepID=UPI0008A1D7B0|nr:MULTISPECIES: ribonuclease domain-containing protein [unclassified Corynebacterium]MBC6757642.1 ribonuclease [Corynebacterium sp. LK24]OFN09777.1 ribonuclease [Corynebacterium sp. HMSC074C11]